MVVVDALLDMLLSLQIINISCRCRGNGGR
jgi:hypothetical protein